MEEKSGKNLKSHQYYSDLYDRHTVEECRRWVKKSDDKEQINKGVKDLKITRAKAKIVLKCVNELSLYFISGERYANKSMTIREWEERDRARDELLEKAKAPDSIACLSCGRLMFVSSKHLDLGGVKGPERVLFMYDCPLGHLPRRAFYHTGEEWRRPPHECPKCKSEFKRETEREEGKKIVMKYACHKCGYVENEEIDLIDKPKEKEKIDRDFAKDRDRFCLSKEEGEKYLEGKATLESIGPLLEEWKERDEHKEEYEAVSKLKKLKITELEELLIPTLEKADYTKLQFKDPEMNKDVFLPFTVYDKQANRSDRESEIKLKKLLDKTLEDTNWRLMSDGVNYRLGMLSGRLRGYEREEDMLKIVYLSN